MSENDGGNFSIGRLFSQAFMPHEEEEIENYWSVGTMKTTPDISEVHTGCPTPWAFVRILGIALAAYALFILCWSKFGFGTVLPGLIFTGCAVIPLSVLMFFFEMNIRKNVSMYLVNKLLVLGGALSILYTGIFTVIDKIFHLNLDNIAFGLQAGVLEELAKLLAVMLVVNKKRYTYILNGMLFGAAVGTGVAIYESAGYALGVFHNASDVGMMVNITLRGALSPFGHIIWLCAHLDKGN